VLQLLPALPPLWQSGHVKGLRARGGFEVDLAWENGRLTEARIISLLGNSCKVMYVDKMVEMETGVGEKVMLDGNLE
jgi:alpha-L-fucosidase 2